MQVDGQLKNAQIELVSGDPASLPLGRMYADIAASGFVPKMQGLARPEIFLTDSKKYAVKSADYVLLLTDDLALFDASGGNKIATLPPAATAAGKVYEIMKIDADYTKKVTVTPDDPGETIDGATTYILRTKNDRIRIMSDGSIWRLIEHTYDREWSSYTGVMSWIANATMTSKWRRNGDGVDLDINVALTGAPTSANLLVSMPGGLKVDTAKMTSSAQSYVLFNSQVLISDAGAERYSGMVAFFDQDYVEILVDDGDKTISTVTQANPITFANTDAVRIKVSGIPVEEFR